VIDWLESLTNAVIGLAVSWAVTFYALPLWGLTPSAGQSAAITGLYFGISLLRGRIIRWGFRKWGS
jgi:hypothetical protein